MEQRIRGKIIKGVGGLYTVAVDKDGSDELSGAVVRGRARGSLRHGGTTPLAGDNVIMSYDAERAKSKKDEEAGFVIEEIVDRRNSLIRPPLANLDYLFVTVAAASPAPVLLTVDKLFSICVYNGIEPVAVITKRELDSDTADRLSEIYRKAGFDTIVTSALEGYGVDELRTYISKLPEGSITAFSGASGVGKSTVLNSLFPELSLSTSQVSKKTERGRHTTRQTELFELSVGERTVYIADTPGFTMLDFEQFDFFTIDDLPFTMREFERYIGECKYKKCTHTKEEGCAIIEAVKSGEIEASRHDSYLSLYDTLKSKKKW